jgi:hypothetical protein
MAPKHKVEVNVDYDTAFDTMDTIGDKLTNVEEGTF